MNILIEGAAHLPIRFIRIVAELVATALHNKPEEFRVQQVEEHKEKLEQSIKDLYIAERMKSMFLFDSKFEYPGQETQRFFREHWEHEMITISFPEKSPRLIGEKQAVIDVEKGKVFYHIP